MGQEPHRRNPHQRHLPHLDETGEARLVETVGNLSCHPRKEKKREDEHPPDEGSEERRVQIGPRRRVEGENHREGILEKVIVERPQKLGSEQRREPPRPEQVQRAAHTASSAIVLRVT